MTGPSAWSATLRIHRGRSTDADRLFASLEPEASREVPRTHVQLRRPSPAQIEIALTARDTGALRAGVNTFLGWVALAERTEAELRLPSTEPR
ncbi:MAG: CTAG/PCC1 family protein [Thermoplasmata archaeon]|nr:CTAG/PCC1 family protein [Thermoplasmata archaeon]